MVNIKYSQNFYMNNVNLQRVIKLSNIKSNDIVLDIGAGTGIITRELSKYAKKVIAYELDKKYFKELENRFKNSSNVILKNKDFLDVQLPQQEFKIFANIPFSITSDIISKIADIDSNLEEAFIFVQKESAERFTGKPRSTQISTILSFVYDINILEDFEKKDFKPVPNVDIVLLNLKRKCFDNVNYPLYRDFVTYIFNQMNGNVLDTFKKLFTFNQLKYIKKELNNNGYVKPSDIPSNYYVELFKYFKSNGEKYRQKIDGYYDKYLIQHFKREKIHRTRIE